MPGWQEHASLRVPLSIIILPAVINPNNRKARSAPGKEEGRRGQRAGGEDRDSEPQIQRRWEAWNICTTLFYTSTDLHAGDK